MNSYKDYLLFTGKCLSLEAHPGRQAEIREIINSGSVNWEKMVYISSNQLVLPALYLQLKKNNLLALLPEGLVEYFDELTELNRQRNISILGQANKISQALNNHGITPTFLKGTALLLYGLYTDIAERMVGDIDLLVAEGKMLEAAEILIAEQGYEPYSKYNPALFKALKHYPRLTHTEHVAAVEVHKEVLNPSHQHFLRGHEVLANNRPANIQGVKASTPSIDNMVIHNIFNAQLNDKSVLYGEVLVRQMYDLLLLAQKTNLSEVANNYGKCLPVINSYYAASSFILSAPGIIKYKKSWKTKIFLSRMKLFLSYPGIWKIYRTLAYFYFRIINYFNKMILFIANKEMRRMILSNLNDKEWYKTHFSSYRKFFKPS